MQVPLILQGESAALARSSVAFASLFCRNFSTQTGVRAATTAVSARAAASLLALPPVIQPPQENPMTTDATAPTAIPCSKRVLDSPSRIEGTCMAFSLSMRGTCAACSTRSNGRGADGTRAEYGSILEWVSCLPTALGCQFWEAENSVCRRFFGSSDARQLANICSVDYGD